jgi:hypothetical protein
MFSVYFDTSWWEYGEQQVVPRPEVILEIAVRDLQFLGNISQHETIRTPLQEDLPRGIQDLLPSRLALPAHFGLPCPPRSILAASILATEAQRITGSRGR